MSPQKESNSSQRKENEKQHWLFKDGELVPKYQSPSLQQRNLMERWMVTNVVKKKSEGSRHQELAAIQEQAVEDREKCMVKDQAEGVEITEMEHEDNRNNAPVSDNINLKEQVGNTPIGSETRKSACDGIGKKVLGYALNPGCARKETEEMLGDSETQVTPGAKRSIEGGKQKRGVKCQLRKRQPLRDITGQQNETQAVGKRKFHLVDEEMEEANEQEQAGKKNQNGD